MAILGWISGYFLWSYPGRYPDIPFGNTIVDAPGYQEYMPYQTHPSTPTVFSSYANDDGMPPELLLLLLPGLR